MDFFLRGTEFEIIDGKLLPKMSILQSFFE